MTYGYYAFDRRVFSERPIELLTELSGESRPTERDITVRWVDDEIEIDGPAAVGHPESAIHGVRAEGGLWAILPGTGSVAWVPENSLDITIHPHKNQRESNRVVSGRRDTDSLVTGLLARMPDRWDALPLHAASLHTPEGVVLICGKSGAGKSTLSHHLALTRGWKLLDDDSSMASISEGRAMITPLGGTPRLRLDAADLLEITGNPLPGFHNPKVAIARDQDKRNLVNEPIVGIFYLFPQEVPEPVGHQIQRTPAVDIQSVGGVEAVMLATTAAVGMDRFSLIWRRKRFEFAQAVGASAQYTVKYTHGAHSAAEVAEGIFTSVTNAI